MMLLSVTIAYHGMSMPYSNHFSNILELVLLSSMLILLLIRNTSYESLNTFTGADKIEYSKGIYLLERTGITSESYVLMILYYFPLILTALGILYWIITSLRLVNEGNLV